MLKKYLKLTIDFLKKYYLSIYTYTLIFSIFFYFLLWGASGHETQLNSDHKISLLLVLFAVLFSNLSNNKIDNKLSRNIILCITLITSLGTLVKGILLLKYFITFKYGDDITIITVGLSYLIPLIFIIVNIILIYNILTQLKTK